MRYKTPLEVRQSLNLRVKTKLAEIPADMRKPIPMAEWAENPKAFSKQRFIEETINFMNKVYGFEPSSYEHPVIFLADEVQTYVDATIGFIESGSEIVVDGKQSPWLKVRDKAILNIIKLSRELGLTPASRLPTAKTQMVEKSVFDILPFPNKKLIKGL